MIVSRENWRLVTLMHVAETREEARKNVEFGLSTSGYFKDISTFPIIPSEFDNAYEYLTENRIALIGTRTMQSNTRDAPRGPAALAA